jgi:hypothetical protein
MPLLHCTIRRIEMDTLTLNHMLNEALLSEIGDGLDSVADRLAALHDGLRRVGGHQSGVESLAAIIGELGWWRGRIDAALDVPSGTF